MKMCVVHTIVGISLAFCIESLAPNDVFVVDDFDCVDEFVFFTSTVLATAAAVAVAAVAELSPVPGTILTLLFVRMNSLRSYGLSMSFPDWDCRSSCDV